jgi:hypothetical protein
MSATVPERSDQLRTIIAILIALVSITGAIVACRTAVASSNAGDADVDGVLAVVDRENALIEGHQALFGYLQAYARAARNDALSDALFNAETRVRDAGARTFIGNEADALIYAAGTSRAQIPQTYLDRDRTFDVERAVGEIVADRSLQKDVFPDPHFERADDARAKSQALLGVLVILGVALIALTLADAIHHPVRYLFLVVGTGIFILSVGLTMLIELFLEALV